MNSKSLIDLLGSNDPYVQVDAAIRLGKNNAIVAAPKLRKLCSDSHQLVALSALHASWMLGEEDLSIERLLQALKSEDEEAKQLAVQIVSARGEQLVPQVTPLLASSREDIELAILILDELGGSLAREALVNLKSNDQDIADLVGQVLDDWD